MKNILLSFAAIGTLAACTYAHPNASPQLTFSQYTPMNLNAQNVGVEEAYIQPNDPQDVSGQFVLAPSEAIKRYAANRFHSSGATTGSFSVVIEDARVHMRQIDQRNKVLEWSGVGKEDEYRLMMQLRVVAQPDGFNGRQSTTIKMDRTLIMPSSIDLAERELRQTQFLEKLISDVDARVEEAIAQTPAIKN